MWVPNCLSELWIRYNNLHLLRTFAVYQALDTCYLIFFLRLVKHWKESVIVVIVSIPQVVKLSFGEVADFPSITLFVFPPSNRSSNNFGWHLELWT